MCTRFAVIGVLAFGVLLAQQATLDAQSTGAGAPPLLTIHADQPVHTLSPYLSGACLEDVNHEVYGGIYSQMIFGESFQEPAVGSSIDGFTALGGGWDLNHGEITQTGDRGGQLVWNGTPIADGDVSLEMFIPDRDAGVAAFTVRNANAKAGIDSFDGYEIALDAAENKVRLGRHQHDYHVLGEAPFDVPVQKWIAVTARLKGSIVEIVIDDKSILKFDDGAAALGAGTVSLRSWQIQNVRYKNLRISTDGPEVNVPFKSAGSAARVSGMWRWIGEGSAQGSADIELQKPFVGSQCQSITYTSGKGVVGVENQGLNRQGIGIQQGKEYEGYIWVGTDAPTPVTLVLQSRDGSKQYAEATVKASSPDWERLDFKLMSSASDPAARFGIELTQPGSLVIGHAFLQPGSWGRYKDLPVRGDVAAGLLDQGIKVLRYGGSLVNVDEYRWKKMLGPRDRRQPYRGNWYPYTSNGWGIIDFLDFCQAAGIHGIPAFNMNESPADMADFVEYVNGGPQTKWGGRRVADGHPAPYELAQIELGNEERIDDVYVAKFTALAEAIWAKDPKIILVVGDFGYHHRISDPMHIQGADSGIKSLQGEQKILALARLNQREVWFDVHVDTDGPGISASMDALPSYIDAIDRLADGAAHRVVVFELNANNPQQHRALANAHAILTIERDGRLPICTSANCLQVDGQNDNAWNQGLLFFNTTHVWLQPPGYVSKMISSSYEPTLIKSELHGAAGGFEVNACLSADGKQLVLQILNNSDTGQAISLQLDGFTPTSDRALVQTLAGPLDASNTAATPDRIVPQKSSWRHYLKDKIDQYTFPPRSFSIIQLD